MRTLALLSFSIFTFSVLSAQSLTVYSGNGQVVLDQFLTTTPLTVLARDASGKPVAGVVVNWAITQGTGTLVAATTITDITGLASTNFLGGLIIPSDSFEQAAITASSPVGAATFFITTSISHSPVGLVAPPLVELLTPPANNRTITATAGSTVPGGVQVRVTAQSGSQAGTSIPNVGVQIINSTDPSLPSAICNGPAGQVLTNAQGVANCDLIIGPSTGTSQLTVNAGAFQTTPAFTLTVTQGVTCTFTISPGSQSFTAAGGAGSFSVTAATGCGWIATSNASWITILSGSSGTAIGSVSYTVAANAGGARSGTLTIAGQTVTVNQAAAAGGTPAPLTIITLPDLPRATVNTPYFAALSATGGIPPYAWGASGSLPPGLALNSSTGIISGTPVIAGTYTFGILLNDSGGANQSQAFNLAVLATTGTLTITSGGFPNGVVGQAYSQPLVSSGGCVTPFSPTPVFSLIAGTLPDGLTIVTGANGSGFSIAGTPTTAGLSTFTLAAKDACGNTVSATFTITIQAAGTQAFVVSPTSLSFGATTQSSQSISVTSAGGSLPFTVTASTTSGGNWLFVSTNSGTTPANIIATVNPAGLAPGTYSGAIVFATSNGSQTVPVTLNLVGNAILSATPAQLSFQAQGAAPAPQVFTVTSSVGSTPFNVTVNTPNGGNWLNVSATSGVTPTVIQVFVSPVPPPGSYTGTITLATSSLGAALAIPVVLTVTSVTGSATPIVGAVTNAASFAPGPVAPGEIVTIFGSNLGPIGLVAAQLNAAGNIDTSDAGTQVFFDEIPAPIIYTSDRQVAAIVPFALYGRSTTQFRLQYNGVTSNTVSFRVADSVPAIFTLDAQGQGAILNQDSSINFPQSGADPGSVVSLFGTGAGQTNPTGMDGMLIGTLLPMPLLPVSVQINGEPATVLYAGGAPGLAAGLLQVNVRVPSDVPHGSRVPVVLTVGNQSSPSVLLSVK